MNYVPCVTWKSLTLCVCMEKPDIVCVPRHGSVMTLLKLNAPSVDTLVLDDGGEVALFKLYPINLNSIL